MRPARSTSACASRYRGTDATPTRCVRLFRSCARQSDSVSITRTAAVAFGYGMSWCRTLI